MQWFSDDNTSKRYARACEGRERPRFRVNGLRANLAEVSI